ncbi:hypothetical protein AVEN_93787-1 [Araneus ventricosus]|uniref:Uncharacterized protein n=1 Tax=Araneus ventricosus TaxID=182803 RepID=A0A4Y2L8F7_ARAVE|nr:hypothetical protein AVEN_93787-1 [Araneus ventricosus]
MAPSEMRERKSPSLSNPTLLATLMNKARLVHSIIQINEMEQKFRSDVWKLRASTEFYLNGRLGPFRIERHNLLVYGGTAVESG